MQSQIAELKQKLSVSEFEKQTVKKQFGQLLFSCTGKISLDTEATEFNSDVDENTNTKVTFPSKLQEENSDLKNQVKKLETIFEKHVLKMDALSEKQCPNLKTEMNSVKNILKENGFSMQQLQNEFSESKVVW